MNTCAAIPLPILPPDMKSIMGGLPLGSAPTGSQYYYDTDADFLRNFNATTRTQDGFDKFAEEWIYGVKDHWEYLEKLGVKRLET